MKKSRDPILNRLSPEEIFNTLEKYAELDTDPSEGRLFAYVYETGLDEIRVGAHRAYTMFVDKNMLDFTVFPSILQMEKDVVRITASLLNGDQGTAGIFTSGGTESNFLAVYSARNRFISRKGSDTVPELVKPLTGHPSLDKAADYMGMRVVNAKLDSETLKADPGSIQELINEKTALVVVSAPDWPFGSIDPVKEVAEMTLEKDIWLHVDGCLGGFILPFLKMLGEDIPDYDLSVEGVYSISADLHKYGYAPKGASLLLLRDKKLKEYGVYTNVRWPGYFMVNPGVLSSRSAGPLAGAWATLHRLGVDGYLELTRKILNAKRKIANGFENLGYRKLGKAEASVVTFTSDTVNVFQVIDQMKKRGWDIQAQPGILDKVPPNMHLTLMPVHEGVTDDMIKDLEEATENVKKLPPLDIQKFLKAISTGNIDAAFSSLGIGMGRLPEEMAPINELMRILPPDIVEDMLKYVVCHLLY